MTTAGAWYLWVPRAPELRNWLLARTAACLQVSASSMGKLCVDVARAQRGVSSTALRRHQRSRRPLNPGKIDLANVRGQPLCGGAAPKRTPAEAPEAAPT